MFCLGFLHVLCFVSDSQSVIVLSLFLLGLQLSFVGRNLYTIPCPTPASAYPFPPLLILLLIHCLFNCAWAFDFCFHLLLKHFHLFVSDTEGDTEQRPKSSNESVAKSKQQKALAAVVVVFSTECTTSIFQILFWYYWYLLELFIKYARKRIFCLTNKHSDRQAERQRQREKGRGREKQGKTMFNCCAGLIYFAFSVSR